MVQRVHPDIEIIRECKEIRVSAADDYRLFSYRLRCGWRAWPVFVYIDRAAMALPLESLPIPLKENVVTFGRAALEDSLRQSHTPKRIFVDESGITVHDRNPRASLENSWTVRLLLGVAFGFYWFWLLGAFGVPKAGAALIAALFGVLLVIYVRRLLEYILPGHADDQSGNHS